MSHTPDVDESERAKAAEAFTMADQTCTFGPSFFLGHLGRFVRNHCPDPQEHLPLVQIRLADGQTFDLCHIVGVSPRWVMLAVRDAAAHPTDMAIEIVPFQMIQGVRIRTRHAEGASAGFSQQHSPSLISAEALVHDALADAMRAAG
jgi:hypothetical protein